MKKRPLTVSHDEWLLKKLRSNPAFAVEYLKASLEEMDEPGGKVALREALKDIAQACGIAKVAKAAGIPRESLSRALSSRGNPRLDTLTAIVHGMGLRLTVQPAAH